MCCVVPVSQRSGLLFSHTMGRKRTPHWVDRFWTKRWIKKHVQEDLKSNFPENRFIYVSEDGFYEDEYEGWTDADWVYVYGPMTPELDAAISELYDKYYKWEVQACALVIASAEELTGSQENPEWQLILDTK